MSGRLAFRPILVLVAAGLLAGALAPLGARTQPSTVPPESPGKADGLDDRPPLPPENTKDADVTAKLRIDKERAIFTGTKDKNGVVKGGIEDLRPLASEKQNADEYQALAAVVLHANQFSAAELAGRGARDLTPDDLTHGVRTAYRLELIRFDGKLAKARRVRATKAIEETGLAELYEGWLVPSDEPTTRPLSDATAMKASGD